MAKPYCVAYLSYDGLTDPLGQSQILPYILGLEAEGFEFTIISFEKPEAYNARRNNMENLIKGKKIKWIPLKYHKRPPVLSTLIDIYLLWQTVRKKHRENPFSIIHCRSYITSLVGQRMKRKDGVKFIFDMRGFWADERVEGGLWNLKNPVYRLVYNFFKKKERQFLKEADQVVSLTYNAKEEIESWGIHNAPISVIPTCVDLNLFDPAEIKKEDQQELRAKLGIKSSDFVLLYLGSWGTWYLTNEMMDFFSFLKKVNVNSKFLIVSEDEIDVDSNPLKDDIIHVASKRQLVPLHISLANLSICFIKSTFSKKASSATKLNEIMAMNIPVVTNAGWGDINLIDNMNLLVCEDLRSPECLLAVLERIKIKNVSSGRDNDFFSLSRGVTSYLNIYDDVQKTF